MWPQDSVAVQHPLMPFNTELPLALDAQAPQPGLSSHLCRLPAV